MLLEIDQIGLLDDEEIELDIAALALSELDHAGLDLEPYLDLLDEIEGRLAEAGGSDPSVEQQAKALSQVIHSEFGFIGDADSYDAPLNADFIRVLDRRRGLPVSLSILYCAAARRLGWSAYALNMPGHVLARIGDEPFVVMTHSTAAYPSTNGSWWPSSGNSWDLERVSRLSILRPCQTDPHCCGCS